MLTNTPRVTSAEEPPAAISTGSRYKGNGDMDGHHTAKITWPTNASDSPESTLFCPSAL